MNPVLTMQEAHPRPFAESVHEDYRSDFITCRDPSLKVSGFRAKWINK